jgi:hypothetical protein
VPPEFEAEVNYRKLSAILRKGWERSDLHVPENKDLRKKELPKWLCSQDPGSRAAFLELRDYFRAFVWLLEGGVTV